MKDNDPAGIEYDAAQDDDGKTVLREHPHEVLIDGFEELKSPTDEYFEIDDAISPDYFNEKRRPKPIEDEQDRPQEAGPANNDESKVVFVIDSPDEPNRTDSFSSIG